MARKKKITLKEFKAWLEGVEELQPKDWSPNVDQWKLIRDKIVQIKEEKVEVPVQKEVQPQPQSQPAAQPVYTPPPAFPPPPSAVPAGEIDMTPEARKLLEGGRPDAPTRTPDIDTTGGEYSSTFT